MIVLEFILLIFLIACAIVATVHKNLLTTVLIFMSYSVVMSIIWVILESPDLAGTEAAVGAGVTTVLFFLALKKTNHLRFRKPGPHEDAEQRAVKLYEEKGEDDA